MNDQMRLRLSAFPLHANGHCREIQHEFDTSGGTIGRDPRCHMSMDDAHNHLPALLAVVGYDHGEFYIQNISQESTIQLGAQTVGPQQSIVMRHGDEWYAGNYRVQAELIRASKENIMAGLDNVLANAEGSTYPRLTAQPTLSSPADACEIGPFGDLMREPINAHLANAPNNEKLPPHYKAYIPDDFNPLAMDGLSTRNTDDPLKQLKHAETEHEMFPEESMDVLFHPEEGTIAELTSDPHFTSSDHALLDASGHLDPLLLFDVLMESATERDEHAILIDATSTATKQSPRTEIGSYFRAPRALLTDTPAVSDQLRPRPPTFTIDPDTSDDSSKSTNFEYELVRTKNSATVDRDKGTPSHQLTSVDLSSRTTESSRLEAGIPTDAGHIHANGTLLMLSSPLLQLETEEASSENGTTAVKQDASVPRENDAEYSMQCLNAFKQGARLHAQAHPEQLHPEILNLLGEMLHSCAEGLIDLLSGSTASEAEGYPHTANEVPNEFDSTLRLTESAAATLAQFLDPDSAAYLTGADAIARSFLEVRERQSREMKRQESAWQEAFAYISPISVEEELDCQDTQHSFFSASRKARLWDIYCARYLALQEQ